jgi:hypothetical protein
MISPQRPQRKEEFGHRWTRIRSMMLWRSTKCLVQAWLVHPFLALHTVPTLPRCHLRSAQPLSEYTATSFKDM